MNIIDIPTGVRICLLFAFSNACKCSLPLSPTAVVKVYYFMHNWSFVSSCDNKFLGTLKKNTITKKGWWSGSRCMPWVQTSVLQKKKVYLWNSLPGYKDLISCDSGRVTSPYVPHFPHLKLGNIILSFLVKHIRTQQELYHISITYHYFYNSNKSILE
jgi:hypothetical protein